MKDEKIEKAPSSQNLKSNQKQNFEFVQNPIGTLKIKKYLGNDTNLTIPSEYNGKKVTMIGKEAFQWAKIKSIVIPSSVKEIDDYAFYDCSNLSKVTLNEGLEQIGLFAFQGTKITSIIIPSSVNKICYFAFGNCSNLSKVILNEGLEKIGHFAFNSTKITSIIIPSSVKEIYSTSFLNCSKLKEIKVNSNNKTYDSHNNCNAIIETKTNTLISGCKNTNIPQGIEKIAECAFEGAKITSITIPSSIKEIQLNPFLNCFKLKEIKVNSNNKTYDSHNNCNAIIETKTNTLISGCKNTNIPQGIEKIGEEAFAGTKIKSIVIPSSINEICRSAFENCSNLSKVTLNEGLEKIDTGVFQRTNISSITIPSSVKEIDFNAFYKCFNLIQVTFNEGLEKIGSYAFMDTKIKSIVIPSSVKEINESAFHCCYNLSKVTLNEGLEKIGSYAFMDAKIKSIVIPRSVKEIGDLAFEYCYNLKKVICKVPKDKITWKWSDLQIDESIVEYA